jgi:putative transposase
MARLARVVIAAMPHHVTQRGNRRQQTFFNDGDYAAYLELMAEWCGQEGVDIWGYCLMPNHVHLIAVPVTEQALRRAIGEAHRRYTRRINFREKWRGYLWQGRFASFVMDEPYLLAAARYVELNPVRARLVQTAAEWRWSSARAHLSGCDDCLVKVAPLLAMVPDWQGLLDSALPEDQLKEFRRHGRTGRPLGNESFVERLEALVGRVLKLQKGGRPRKQEN